MDSAAVATERALMGLAPGFPTQIADAILSGVRKQQTTFLRALDSGSKVRRVFVDQEALFIEALLNKVLDKAPEAALAALD